MEKHKKSLYKLQLYIPLGILMSVINANYLLNVKNIATFINKPTAWVIALGFAWIMVQAIDKLNRWWVIAIALIEAFGMHVFLKIYEQDATIASIYFAVYFFTTSIAIKFISDKEDQKCTEKEQLNKDSYISINTQLTNELNQLKDELASLKIAHKITGHNYTSTSLQNEELSKRLAELTKKNEELTCENTELSTQVDNLIYNSQNHKKTIDELGNSNIELQTNIHELVQKNEELEENKDNFIWNSAQHNEQLNELDKIIGELNNTNRELRKEIEELEIESKEIYQVKHEFVLKNIELEQQIRELTEKQHELSKHNLELKNKIVEFEILNDHKEAYADLHKKMKQGGNPERIAATEAIINLLN